MKLEKNAAARKVDPGIDPLIDPQIRGFLKVLNEAGKGQTPIFKLPGTGPADALTGLQDQTAVDLSGVETTERIITMDGIAVPIHVVRPGGVKEPLPVIMFFHGGVWIVGSYDNHKRLARDLAIGTHAVVVFVDYTLIPEAKYPVQINQAYAAAKWVALHGNEINADGSRIAVAGNSVGGNMAATVALMAKDRSEPVLRFQLLLYPSVDTNFDTESYAIFADDRFLSREFMQFGWDIYAPGVAARKERYAAPLQATVQQLKGLPPTLIQTAENDPLRDEGEAYGRKLSEAGVACTVTRYNSMIHDFQLLNAINDVPAVQASIRQACLELKHHLQ